MGIFYYVAKGEESTFLALAQEARVSVRTDIVGELTPDDLMGNPIRLAEFPQGLCYYDTHRKKAVPQGYEVLDALIVSVNRSRGHTVIRRA